MGSEQPRTVWATNDGPAHRGGNTVQQQPGVQKYSTLTTPNADHERLHSNGGLFATAAGAGPAP